MKAWFQVGLLVFLLGLTGCETPQPDKEPAAVPPEPIPLPVLRTLVTPPAPPGPTNRPSLLSPPKLTLPPVTVQTNPAVAAPWLGLQLFIQSNEALNALATAMPRLASNGVNVIIVDVGYHFDFKSHPELRRGKVITRANAKKLAAIARANGVRLIPELDCLGHQSEKNYTKAFLATYPEFTEPSPSQPDLKTAYLKSWCPNNPRVEPIIFDLIDEIARAFDADAFHVGMDEIFNLSSDNCPRCRGQEPAKLFAKVVNDLHAHIVDTNKLEMFMWGDRLLDARKTGYSQWEASRIGTAGAIDLIPTNIVICDWHYGKRAAYPSVPLFLQKGFRVWPAGFQPLEASRAFSDYAQKLRAQNPRVMGYLCTTWTLGKPETVADWPPAKEILKDWKTPEAVSTNSP
ncbi:MAG: family 20 glycosylhydrolase [Verrucomicrobiae bacterium]|nr:family 20 glycosylhydrolase [Verrucomicrobiae bacterium]